MLWLEPLPLELVLLLAVKYRIFLYTMDRASKTIGISIVGVTEGPQKFSGVARRYTKDVPDTSYQVTRNFVPQVSNIK